MNQLVNTKIVLSDSYDPWHNLALEEFLFRSVEKNQVILYLWQNQNTVVIGRNQNAWKECRCTKLEDDGGKLARRLSGGGAVFHDLGNLNFTFIMDRSLYDLHKQLQVILEGTKKLGINAEFTGRNDLTVDGKKFSGNAFYFEGNKAYHHGTVMIDVDVEKVSAYLQVSKEKMASKGVNSVHSRVTNLRSYRSNLTIDEMKETLQQSFQELYGKSPEPITIKENGHDLKELYAKYSSWDWLYGKTPQFDVVLETRFPWGGIDLGLTLRNGRITESKIYSDAMNANLIKQIADSLVNLPLTSENILLGLKDIDITEEDKQVIGDMKTWLQSKIKEI
ncbi:lipoate--protein ligase [Desulfitobacterium sp. Sab5]|uniref:lipoate--protein ligase n=1 Tax=Desulfitobacterium TaxID=36853 RepID=UPI003CF3D328